MSDLFIFLLNGYSSGSSALKLVGLIILCFIIIIASYYTTKFVGGRGTMTGRSTFMRPLEAIKLSQNTYLQLVKIGERYFVIAVGKESVSVVTEVDKSEIPDKKAPELKNTFKDILLSKATGIDNPSVENSASESEPEQKEGQEDISKTDD